MSLVERWIGMFNDKAQERLTSFGLLFLRLSFGGMMLGAHGSAKLLNFNAYAERFSDPLGLGALVSLILAVFAEFFCSLAVIFGFATRLAVIPLATTMMVAAGIVHMEDPWGKKEFALLYLFAFVTLFLAGPGRFSIDAKIRARFA